MPDLAALAQFVIGPGGALALALFLIVAVIRGWLVPGFVYDKADARLDRSLAVNETVSAALDRLTDEIRAGLRDRS